MGVRAVRFVVIGAGPAGNQAATTAARLGAEVTLVENQVVGGAAHRWDCIPSKALIAAGEALGFGARAERRGVTGAPLRLDLDGLRVQVGAVGKHLRQATESLLGSQGVRLVRGRGRLVGPRAVGVAGPGGEEVLEADAVLVATGSRPRVPDWCEPDGERILLSRHAYPPPVVPDHLVVVGSGVTGVEMVHLFASLGSAVTLVVSRQHVLPGRDPEVAAALEDSFEARGIRLVKGARAIGARTVEEAGSREGSGGRRVVVTCHDGRVATGSHALVAIGSVPNTGDLGLAEVGVALEGGYVTVDRHCRTSVPGIYAAGDVSGKLPLSSVGAMQGRKVAEDVMGLHTRAHRHLDYEKAAQAIFTDPEIAEVGVAEAEAFASGRKIRSTKVPFAASARALIDGDPRGFLKILSDPATGVVLGGAIVGRGASELISVIALAVTAGLRVSDVADTLLVHPSLAESLAEAAE